MKSCDGPFIWYGCVGGALLVCATCGHATVTGNINDAAHAATPILAEGVA